MENLRPNHAQLFLRNEYAVFTMSDTVALRFSIPTAYDRRTTDLKLEIEEIYQNYSQQAHF